MARRRAQWSFLNTLCARWPLLLFQSFFSLNTYFSHSEKIVNFVNRPRKKNREICRSAKGNQKIVDSSREKKFRNLLLDYKKKSLKFRPSIVEKIRKVFFFFIGNGKNIMNFVKCKFIPSVAGKYWKIFSMGRVIFFLIRQLAAWKISRNLSRGCMKKKTNEFQQ